MYQSTKIPANIQSTEGFGQRQEGAMKLNAAPGGPQQPLSLALDEMSKTINALHQAVTHLEGQLNSAGLLVECRADWGPADSINPPNVVALLASMRTQIEQATNRIHMLGEQALF